MFSKILVSLSVAFILIFPMHSYAQSRLSEGIEKGEPATKLEQFLSKKGRFYVKDFYNAGKVTGQYEKHISVEALIVYEPGKEVEKNRGLKIEVYEGGPTEKSGSSFLDIEEVESLSRALEYMVSLINKFKDSNREYTEVIFSTKGEFKVGFYQKNDEFKAFCSSGLIRQSTCFLPVDSLPNLKSVIDKGLSLAKK